MEAVFAYEYTPSARIRVSDEDSADFLQSQFSNDLRPFTLGQCTYGLWLDVKGKVLADAWVLCEGSDQFLVLSEHSPVEVIYGTLDGHIIADDVELEVLDQAPAIALVGAMAAELLARLDLNVPSEGSFSQSHDLLVFGGRRAAERSYELVALNKEAAVRLRKKLLELDVEFVSKERIQLERILAGVPAVPCEIGVGELPGEGGFEADAVSFAKGCFLGQEVVARMHNVGQARRGLFRVSGGTELPEVPSELTTADGKSAGELRTVVAVDGGWKGVALLKLRLIDEPALYIMQSKSLGIDGPLREQK